MTRAVMHCFRLLQIRVKQMSVFATEIGRCFAVPSFEGRRQCNLKWRQELPKSEIQITGDASPKNRKTVKQADNSICLSMAWPFHAALKRSETERSSRGRNWGATFGMLVDRSDGRSMWAFDRCEQQTYCADSHLAPVFHFDPTGKVIANFGADTFAAPYGIPRRSVLLPPRTVAAQFGMIRR
jgi:hypothetical protein